MCTRDSRMDGTCASLLPLFRDAVIGDTAPSLVRAVLSAIGSDGKVSRIRQRRLVAILNKFSEDIHIQTDRCIYVQRCVTDGPTQSQNNTNTIIQ